MLLQRGHGEDHRRVAAQRGDMVLRSRTVQREQHRHRVHRRREIPVLAVQRLGGEVSGDRLAVAGERTRRDRPALSLEHPP